MVKGKCGYCDEYLIIGTNGIPTCKNGCFGYKNSYGRLHPNEMKSKLKMK